MGESIRDSVLRGYMGKFAVDRIDKRIFDVFRDVDVHKNIIILCRPDAEIIRSIVATLIIKDHEFLKYGVLSLKEIADRTFGSKAVADNENSYSDAFYRPDVLFVVEFMDTKNEQYRALVTSMIGKRSIDRKSTILIFTQRTPSELIPPDVQRQMQRIDLTSYMAPIAKKQPPKAEKVEIPNKEFRNVAEEDTRQIKDIHSQSIDAEEEKRREDAKKMGVGSVI